MYCSEKCRLKAYHAYHRTECQMIKFCLEGAIQKALQLFLIGTEQGKSLSTLTQKVTPADLSPQEFAPPALPFVRDYWAVINAMRKKKSWNEDMHLWADMILPLAVDAVIVLRNLSFFGAMNSSQVSFSGGLVGSQ